MYPTTNILHLIFLFTYFLFLFYKCPPPQGLFYKIINPHFLRSTRLSKLFRDYILFFIHMWKKLKIEEKNWTRVEDKISNHCNTFFPWKNGGINTKKKLKIVFLLCVVLQLYEAQFYSYLVFVFENPLIHPYLLKTAPQFSPIWTPKTPLNPPNSSPIFSYPLQEIMF